MPPQCAAYQRSTASLCPVTSRNVSRGCWRIWTKTGSSRFLALPDSRLCPHSCSNQQGLVADPDEEPPAEELANVTINEGADAEGADAEGAQAEGKVKGPKTTKKGAKLKEGDKVLPGGKVDHLPCQC